jgi:hypothetical protein
MATRKSTTTRSTTTTPTRKRTTKSAAASTRRTTAKTRTAKTTRTAKVTEVSATPSSGIKLSYLLVTSVIIYILLAAAAAFLMRPAVVGLNLTHLTTDALLSQESTVFIPASRALFDIDLRWIIFALMVISMALPLLYLTKLKNYYLERVANRRVIGLRWIDLAVGAALMTEVIAVLVGYTDILMLKLMGTLIGVTCALGWVAELQNESSGTRRWSAYIISLFTGTAPWAAIVAALAGTLIFGMVRNTWFVYAAVFSVLIGFILVALNQFNQHRRIGASADYAFVERNYVLFNMLTKVAFAGILIAGFAK